MSLSIGHALAFLLGCCALLLLPQLPSPAQLGLAMLVSLALLALARIWRPAQLLCCVLLGLAYASVTATGRLDARLPAAMQGVDLDLRGYVAGLARREGRALRFDFQAEPAAAGSFAGLLRLSWYDPTVQVEPGECLHLRLRLKRPRGSVNPGGFDFERYAAARGLAATGHVVRALPLPAERCAPKVGIDRLRQSLSLRIDEELPEGSARALLKALALGDTRDFDASAWDRFRATGTNHLVAISGLHIGLAAGFGGALVWLLYLLRPGLGERLPRPQAMAMGGLLLALGYALLAGFTLPTQRALIALAALLAGVLARREIGWWQRYALAMLGVLLVDPLAPLGAGFWLSFAAVGWLILAFSGRWRAQSRWQMLLLPQLGLGLVMLPLGLGFFQQASLLAPLANLLAVPWVSLLAVPVTLAALLALPLPWLGEALLHLAHGLLALLDAWIGMLSAWPAARIALPSPQAWAWMLAMLGCACLLAPRGWPLRLLGGMALLPILLPRQPAPSEGAFWVTVFDVGQGQAVLLQTQRHALLYDTGPGFPDGGDLGQRVLLPSLLQLGVRRLDAIVVSHSDLDHSGGTASLLASLPVARVLGSDTRGPDAPQPCLRGQRWTWDGVDFEMLHPPDTLPYVGNESSCTLRVSSAAGSMLLPGDLGEVSEMRLLREQPEALAAQVLLAGHHGSAGSSTAAFLAAVAPQWVVYSAGHRNRFNFPRPEVRRRVAAVGAGELNTGEDGAIRILFTRNGSPQILRLREQQHRWWRER